jgi:hypothetical protein
MTAPPAIPAPQQGRSVRALAASDLPHVARLFQKTFRGKAGPAPASLAAYLGDLFLGHPWYDPELSSRVHLSPDGAVDGFIGVLPSRMTFSGRRLRAGIAGSLMVDAPGKNPLAGARLFRAFLSGPQDISLSETANPVSQGMWRRLGGQVLPLASMEFIRVLKPARAGIAMLAGAMPMAKLLSPLAWAADGVLSRMGRNPFRADTTARSWRDEDADEDRFIAYALAYASRFSLRPDWDAPSLRWLLTHAEQKQRHGRVSRRLVYGNGPNPIGGYIVYTRPGGVAWVLHILAEPARVEPILDSLTAHALNHGAVAVRGRTHPMLMDPLLKRGTIFVHRSSTLVHARDPALIEAASGDALITGLAGETWTGLIGGIFR